MPKINRLIALLVCAACPAPAQYTISTIAGGSLPNHVPANTVSFTPHAVAIDKAGNLFVAEQNVIYQINPAGDLAIFAGNGQPGSGGDGGPAAAASFSNIASLVLDPGGNLLISDSDAGRVRKVDAATGMIRTVAGGGTGGDGGPATSAQLGGPTGIAIDAAGNIYIAEPYNQRVRRVSAASGLISTLAGNGVAGSGGDGGPALFAQLNGPQRLAVDPQGNLYIGEIYGCRVRKVNTFSGTINTVAGTGASGFSGDGGLPTSAMLSNSIAGLAVDAAGNLYISDAGNNRIRKVAPDLSSIVTVAGGAFSGFQGDGGAAENAALNGPGAIALDDSNTLYIADSGNNRIRRVTLPGRIISTVVGGGSAGDGGPARSAQLNHPTELTADAAGNLYINDCGNSRIRMVTRSTGTIGTVAGRGYPGFGGDRGSAISALIQGCGGMAPDNLGALYLADSDNYRVRKIMLSAGMIATVAGGAPGSTRGDLPADQARFHPDDVAVDALGNVYIADALNNLIREIRNNGTVSTIAGTGMPGFSGDGGSALQANLSSPHSVALDAAGNIFFADSNNHRIRRISASSGIITTVAGVGLYGHSGDAGPANAALVGYPTSLVVDSAGSIYFVEGTLGYVRKIGAGGIIDTIAGGGSGGDGSPGTSARLDQPTGLAVDSTGAVYISEPRLNRVRKLSLPTQTSLIIITSTLPGGIVGTNYGQVLSAAGGTLPYRRWVLLNGSLPPGLTLDVSNGVLSGVPEEPGVYPFTMQVTDNANLSTTKALTLTVTAPPFVIPRDGVLNAASLAGGAVAPGELISIFGAGFGPDTPVTAQPDDSGVIGTMLAGTRVLFDGIAATVLSVQSNQVSAVVPYSVAGKNTATVQVEFNGQRSNSIVTPVLTAMPALFTADSSGKGAGYILNEDGSPNSADNPATAGSQVTCFATGAGQTDPLGIDGLIASVSLPKPLLPVSLRIGGIDAQVVYAGAQPGAVAGMLQVIARVPANLTSGPAAVVVTVGSYGSSTDVTMSIR